MTPRDPYTGVPSAPRPTRPFAQRWWPVLLIAAIAAIAGFAEWQSATRPHSPVPAITATVPNNPGESGAKSSTTPPSASSGDLAAATVALTKASDQLDRTAELLIGIAALQILVLAGQLYLLGRQRRAEHEDRP